MSTVTVTDLLGVDPEVLSGLCQRVFEPAHQDAAAEQDREPSGWVTRFAMVLFAD